MKSAASMYVLEAGTSPMSARIRPIPRNWRSAGSLAIVLALHAGALYAVTREAEFTAPAVSVPMVISLATVAESVPAKHEPKQRSPEPKLIPSGAPAPAIAPENETSPKQEQNAPAEVIPPNTHAAYLNNPQPDYPPLSRKLGEQGRVVLHVFVDADGTVRDVQINTSSGWTRLDRAARDGVSRWKFEPARQGRQAVGAWTLVPISFVLNKG
jgi:protein TonB